MWWPKNLGGTIAGQHNTELQTIAEGVASYATTDNHWSDDITSRAYVRDIAVPYFKKKINAYAKSN